jgi:lytic murein transglycosylase
MKRRAFLALAFASAALPLRAFGQAEDEAAGLDNWLARVEAMAREAGLPAAAMAEARAGLRFNADLVQPAGAAAESRRVGQYIDTLIRREGPIARDKRAEHPRLAEIEAAYGVPASALVALWGRETSYGALMGGYDVFSTLATRGTAGLGRTDWMREYVAALKMIVQGIRPRALMTGSASGAMGHTQLMPSNVLIYGEDFDGDGQVNLWSASPLDAMASAARHIQAAPVSAPLPEPTQRPWIPGRSWILPVRLPAGFDFAEVEVDETRLSPAEWRARGAAPLHEDWREADESADAKLALPAGLNGPALLLPGNFDVFEAYNPSRTYALAVALLARHIEGGAPLSWPEESPLSVEERQQAQRGLTVLGHYGGPIDGDLGAGSRRALRAWQRANGRAPDGYLTAEMAREIGAAAPR